MLRDYARECCMRASHWDGLEAAWGSHQTECSKCGFSACANHLLAQTTSWTQYEKLRIQPERDFILKLHVQCCSDSVAFSQYPPSTALGLPQSGGG